MMKRENEIKYPKDIKNVEVYKEYRVWTTEVVLLKTSHFLSSKITSSLDTQDCFSNCSPQPQCLKYK